MLQKQLPDTITLAKSLGQDLDGSGTNEIAGANNIVHIMK
jgi:hypothetical protein